MVRNLAKKAKYYAEAYRLARMVTEKSIDALETYARNKIPLDKLQEKVAWRDRSIIALRGLKDARGTVERG